MAATTTIAAAITNRKHFSNPPTAATDRCALEKCPSYTRGRRRQHRKFGYFQNSIWASVSLSLTPNSALPYCVFPTEQFPSGYPSVFQLGTFFSWLLCEIRERERRRVRGRGEWGGGDSTLRCAVCPFVCFGLPTACSLSSILSFLLLSVYRTTLCY